MNDLERFLKQEPYLPDNPDIDAINDLRMKINSKIVESAGREVDAKTTGKNISK